MSVWLSVCLSACQPVHLSANMFQEGWHIGVRFGRRFISLRVHRRCTRNIDSAVVGSGPADLLPNGGQLTDATTNGPTTTDGQKSKPAECRRDRTTNLPTDGPARLDVWRAMRIYDAGCHSPTDRLYVTDGLNARPTDRQTDLMSVDRLIVELTEELTNSTKYH